jgi:hypothetical protein
MVRASSASGKALVPMFLIAAAVRDIDQLEMSSDFLIGVLLASALLWGFGALFAFVLLIPLKPIADRVRPWLSLSLFLLAGLGVSELLVYQALQIGSHGNPPPILKAHWTDLAISIVWAGVMGLGCALAAWFSIRKSAASAT